VHEVLKITGWNSMFAFVLQDSDLLNNTNMKARIVNVFESLDTFAAVVALKKDSRSDRVNGVRFVMICPEGRRVGQPYTVVRQSVAPVLPLALAGSSHVQAPVPMAKLAKIVLKRPANTNGDQTMAIVRDTVQTVDLAGSNNVSMNNEVSVCEVVTEKRFSF
jgi:hypothetical protein